jgi:hypothetical protein
VCRTRRYTSCEIAKQSHDARLPITDLRAPLERSAGYTRQARRESMASARMSPSVNDVAAVEVATRRNLPRPARAAIARSNRLRMRMRATAGNRPPARTTATRCRRTTTRSGSSLPIRRRGQGRKTTQAEMSTATTGQGGDRSRQPAARQGSSSDTNGQPADQQSQQGKPSGSNKYGADAGN